MAKYDALRDYLAALDADRVELAFEEVERIVALPPTAYWYKEFWTNTPGHAQADAWMAAGWRVASLEPRKRVTFVRSTNSEA